MRVAAGRLRPDVIVRGPANITKYSSTTLLPPGARADVLRSLASSITL